MNPISLPSNRPADRFYRGGPKITAFRGEQGGSDRQPEDWVGSTTSLFGEHALGITVLPDSVALPEAVEAQPKAWLGEAHLAATASTPGCWLRCSTRDSGYPSTLIRMPRSRLDISAAVMEKRRRGTSSDGGDIYLCLLRDINLEELQGLVDSQDVEALLGLLHRIEVPTGDIVYVPTGVLHAIGAGVFFVEIQEPGDMSILLEWRDFELDGPRDGHLGIGFDLALRAVGRTARTSLQVGELVRPAGYGPSVLPNRADEYFRLEHVKVDGETTLEPGFGVLVGLRGQASCQNVDLRSGTTVLAPHDAGPLTLHGQLELLVCRPPRPR